MDTRTLLASGTWDRPVLLMLSHCLPEETGGGERRRAWDLLRTAARTHRVWLACLLDAPVRLDQWRAVHAAAERAALELPPRPRWLGRGRGLHAAVAPRIRGWAAEAAFDAALATHPALWPAVQAVPARIRLVDTGAAGAAHAALPPDAVTIHHADAMAQILRPSTTAEFARAA